MYLVADVGGETNRQMKVKRRSSQADVPSMAMGDIAFNLLIWLQKSAFLLKDYIKKHKNIYIV